MSCNYFPYDPDEATAMKNPAIQLFGNRLFIDQTVSELLVEFLLVVFSIKRIEPDGVFNTTLPNQSTLKDWDGAKLEYAPKARLNLKLFSFLGASRLDSRHQTHRSHHEELLKQFKERINIAGAGEKEDVVRTIENLFLGFQGAGSGRTWCAQSFLPVSASLLAGETIWNETEARRRNPECWEDITGSLSTYLTMNKHRFLGRGGELLYLQLCNALRQPKEDIELWCQKNDIRLSDDEQNPIWLHKELEKALGQLMCHCPGTLSELATFIDTTLDPDTPQQTDWSKGDRRFVSAGWCNADSWQEGYLFTVELLRLLQTNLDIVERIYLLENACAMQVLRTLAIQSARVAEVEVSVSWPGYRLAVSAPEEDRPAIRRLSQYSLKAVEKIIFQALRSNHVALPEGEVAREKALKDSDKSYGGKLFVGLSKRIGFVVPKRGSGARFVLNEQLLRMLVVTTVPIGGRLTFDTFKELLERRHGLVFDADGFDRASRWLSGKGIYLSADTDCWLQEMLEAAGFLIHLSDSCALVHNPADHLDSKEKE
jgi:hypothetical protein